MWPISSNEVHIWLSLKLQHKWITNHHYTNMQHCMVLIVENYCKMYCKCQQRKPFFYNCLEVPDRAEAMPAFFSSSTSSPFW